MFAEGPARWPYQPVVLGGGEEALPSHPDADLHDRRNLHRLVVEPEPGPSQTAGRARTAAWLALLAACCLLLAAVLSGARLQGRVPRPRLMLDGGPLPTPYGTGGGAAPQGGGGGGGGGCMDSAALSDLSSKDHMERFGWLFGWTGRDAFRPEKVLYARSVPSSSYWGFSESVDGEIALILRGRGFFTLDFGNSWSGPESQVVVYLNGVPQSRAGANAISMFVKAPFRDGDVLRLVESNGVIVINSIFFDCTGVPLPESSTSSHTATETHTSTSTASTTSEEASTSTTTRPSSSSTATTTSPPATSTTEDILSLRRRARKQMRSEGDMLDALAKESKELKRLEREEKEELLKAQEDMRLKQNLQKELHRMMQD